MPLLYMSKVQKLRKAGAGWVSKAMVGVDNKELLRELRKVNNMIHKGMRSYDNDNYPDAVANIGDAKRTLEELRQHPAWDAERSYYRCIYEGGDGSAYESGFYRSVKAEDSVEALDLLLDEMYEESPILSR